MHVSSRESVSSIATHLNHFGMDCTGFLYIVLGLRVVALPPSNGAC